MKIAVPKETRPQERRVALDPDRAKVLVQAGHEVAVETGAGAGAFYADAAYEGAGAKVAPDTRETLAGAQVVLRVNPPTTEEIAAIPEGALLISFLYHRTNPELLERLNARKITALSMDAIPRITRAQPMDALSSQSTVAGYKAVLLAANALPKMFPMLTTAAGTITPAKVFVLGAGVAGLQAIATARRLGAVVAAFDIRPAVKEEVESLGARFVGLVFEEAADTSGYAKEVSEEHQRQEREQIAKHVKESDIVITTALVPGKKAPLLVTAEMVRTMRPGSVIVDLAAEQGGNCELTRPGEEVEHEGVKVIGPLNLPAALSVNASQMYARNVYNLLSRVLKEEGVALDFEDEIIKGCCITHEGRTVAQG